MTEHVIVINRWSDGYADYAAYLDHAAFTVSYVTTRRGHRAVPAKAAGHALVETTDDLAQLRAATAALIREHGAPARLVALHEGDLDAAAQLRVELGLPGQRPDDLRPFRDKLAMARRVAAAGIPVPATGAASDHAAVREFAAQHGWPLILKPRSGFASAHVSRLDSPADLDHYVFPPGVPMLVQPYLPHPVLHVDGVATGSALGPWRASRYLSTCLEFTGGSTLGSVEIDDDALGERIGAFTDRVARAMSDGPWVFHLEVFLHEREGREPELVFLEVAARTGGAEIPFLWREVHGTDLMAHACALQLDGLPGLPRAAEAAAPPAGTVAERPGEVGGWLLVPAPATRPARVRSAPTQLGLPAGPYAEVLPAPGRIVAAAGGYEHVGARFRFRGRSSAEVEAAVRATAERFRLDCVPLDPAARPRLVVVGSGGRPYREYAFASLARRADVLLLHSAEADWQRAHLRESRQIDTRDPQALARAADAWLGTAPGPSGVLTWDETALEVTARAAELLGAPHLSALAAANCRDKLATRRLLSAAGVPSARYRHVRNLAQARAAAAAIGYPVVVKPRSLAGSLGVALAADPAELAEAFARAGQASFPGLDAREGVIIEEFLRGPEISVDSVVVGGAVRCVNVARKRLGFAPYFEEVGHLVSPWRHEPWADAVVDAVTRAHAALGVETGVTHAELRLTPDGPRLVELNGRLGGDLIPRLGHLATGIDLVAAAAEVALGRTPDLTATQDRCAEIRFVYPEHDGVVRSLDLTAATRTPGVEAAFALAAPGDQLLLPPRGLLPRLAALVVTGPDAASCTAAADTAARRVRADVAPLSPPPLTSP
ncbi:acetyl-CoA carboxylase biotin carboxylase subunit family protein [Kitasatospora sp. NPDC050543]|uniref:acetyl-CoA carboxylase biotin carboxylase subunit family protein n=1 Tax=Kitasatospora sp. NPDC050543 TaxID=3364054 RepID=UPI00378A2560